MTELVQCCSLLYFSATSYLQKININCSYFDNNIKICKIQCKIIYNEIGLHLKPHSPNNKSGIWVFIQMT